MNASTAPPAMAEGTQAAAGEATGGAAPLSDEDEDDDTSARDDDFWAVLFTDAPLGDALPASNATAPPAAIGDGGTVLGAAKAATAPPAAQPAAAAVAAPPAAAAQPAAAARAGGAAGRAPAPEPLVLPSLATPAPAPAAAAAAPRVRRLRIAMRPPEPPPSDAMYEAARAVFDAMGPLMADDFYGRPLRNRCWVAEQPPEITSGKPNCAASQHGDKCLACLPAFYLAGAPKCGTTVLWQTLEAHPQVAWRRVKEHHFWDWLWPSNAAESLLRTERYSDSAGGDYMAHAAHVSVRRGGGAPSRLAAAWPELNASELAALPVLVGDADPNYLYSHMRFPWVTAQPPEEDGKGAGEPPPRPFSTAEVLRGAVPDAKVILVLREPGARALSHMRMVCEGACRREAARAAAGAAATRAHEADLARCGRCPVGAAQWAEVAARELDDLRLLCTGAAARNGSAAPLAPDCAAPHALHAPGGHRVALRAVATGTWVGRSIYYHWLQEWLASFPEPEQLLVLRYEDWVAAPAATAAQVFRFLGLRPLPADVAAALPRPRNATAGDDAEAATPATRAALRAFFAPFNAQLAALLGDDKWRWEDYYAAADLANAAAGVAAAANGSAAMPPRDAGAAAAAGAEAG